MDTNNLLREKQRHLGDSWVEHSKITVKKHTSSTVRNKGGGVVSEIKIFMKCPISYGVAGDGRL